MIVMLQTSNLISRREIGVWVLLLGRLQEAPPTKVCKNEDDDDDNLYIMVKCMCVCVSVCLSVTFFLILLGKLEICFLKKKFFQTFFVNFF